MSRHLYPPLEPRDGRTLQVIIVARISTEHQDEKSLDDQVELCRSWLRENSDYPVNERCISSRGSGECLDRVESAELEALVESRQFDLVINEDLGRIYRRITAMSFCEDCQDAGIRLIAINDRVDTAQEDWQFGATFSVLRHEGYNRDTSKRIRRSLRNRFQQGGIIKTTIYGYIKPPGCKFDSDLVKDPDAEQVYETWFTMLEDGASFAEVADWLNDRGIPPGPHSGRTEWTGTMVGRVTRNPILKGLRQHNRKICKRINKTGRRKAVPAPPEELLERECPHLAFIEPSRFDRVIRQLGSKNARSSRKHRDGHDSRAGVSKKRTIWPAQHLRCGICGQLYYRGGHGRKDHLMCAGNREYRCWNGVSFDGPTAARRILDAILTQIEALPDYDPLLRERIQRAVVRQFEDRQGKRTAIDQKQTRLEREIQNVLAAIRSGDAPGVLVNELKRLQDEEASLKREADEFERTVPSIQPLPAIDELKRLARDAVLSLAPESPEFGRLMQRLVPKLVVLPYRLCNGGHIVLRAHLTLQLTHLAMADASLDPGNGVLCYDLTVDLFDEPQRVPLRARVVELIARGWKQRDVASELGTCQPEIQRAIALDKAMKALNISDPYLLLEAPPVDSAALKKHLHPRYRQEAAAMS